MRTVRETLEFWNRLLVARSSSLAGLTPPSQRRRILDAMVACCAEKTYAATTIADLVSRAASPAPPSTSSSPTSATASTPPSTHCIERIAATLAAAAAGPRLARRGDPARRPSPGSSCSPPSRSWPWSWAATWSASTPTLVDRYGRFAVPALEALWARGGRAAAQALEPRARLRPRPAAGLPRGRRRAGRSGCPRWSPTSSTWRSPRSPGTTRRCARRGWRSDEAATEVPA